MLKAAGIRLAGIAVWGLPLLLFGVYALNTLLTTRSGNLGDFYPHYWGARAWLASQNGYDLASSGSLAATFTDLFAVGNPYPLPTTLLLGLPLSWLPPTAAAIAFAAILLGAITWAARWSGSGPWVLWWIPVWSAATLYQASLLSVFGALLLWGGRQRRSIWIISVAAIVLSLKPQEGALLVLLAAIWAGKRWWVVLGAVAVPWIGSLFLQPSWPSLWLDVVLHRNDALRVAPIWVGFALLPVAALMVLWASRQQHYPRDGIVLSAVTVAQAGLIPWPIPAFYSANQWVVGVPEKWALAATGSALVLAMSLPETMAPWSILSSWLLGWGYLMLQTRKGKQSLDDSVVPVQRR